MLTFLTFLSVAVLGGATPPPVQNTPSIQTCEEVQSRPIEKTPVEKTPVTTQITPPVSPKVNQPLIEVEGLITKYANQFGTDANLMKKIARCESRFNPHATNGQYAGMYQFGTSTWISTRKQMGLDTNIDLRFSAEEAIKTAAFKLANGGHMAWKACL